jgi:hypothetical protein
MKRTAFVVMPIKSGQEFQHFLEIYENYIKPPLEKLDFIVNRADQSTSSGAISKDIIVKIAESDLVVADLSDLNPNVFYELGVRHALRKSGTIIVIDTIRTADSPFDLKDYRHIKYEGKIGGLSVLLKEIRAFAVAFLEEETGAKADNPVHDWIPALPRNVLESASASLEGKLRNEISDLQKKILRYEARFGVIEADQRSSNAPSEVISRTLTAARQKSLPIDVVQLMREAVEPRDREKFLESLNIIVENDIALDRNSFLQIAAWSSILGLTEVSSAVLRQAVKMHPSDRRLKNALLGGLSQSFNPSDRAQARKEIMDMIGISISETEMKFPANFPRDFEELISIMLDAFSIDRMSDHAYKLTKVLFDKMPDRSRICRLHARVVEDLDGFDSAYPIFRQAILCKDVEDTTATWFGNSLHNARRRVDALEAYLFAALLDPNDGSIFSHCAEELSRCELDRALKDISGSSIRLLPQEIDAVKCTVEFSIATLSCSSRTEDSVLRCQEALIRVGKSIRDIQESASFDVRKRIEISNSMFSILRSKLTMPDIVENA